jgi:Rrf2 family protein
MRISKKAEYALRALGVMAREPKAWRTEELSVREKIPVKFLEQILLTLRHAGMLSAKRGVGGGYALLRGPQSISVGEVIRALDGPLAPVPCVAEKPTERCSCPDPRTCPVRAVMQEVHRNLSAALDQRSIEDMLRLAGDGGPVAFEI